MVSQKEALMRLWKDSCDITIKKSVKDETTKQTTFAETTLYANQQCKLSFETLSPTDLADHVPLEVQTTKLFIDADLNIPSGSKITVYRRGALLGAYQRSGEPGIFTAHQEIPLQIWKEWA